MHKTILITGATGFVGRQILKVLDKGNHQFVLPLRIESQKKLSPIENQHTIVFTENLFSESFKWWEANTKGVDLIIHCAWYVETGKYLESTKNLECLTGSIEMVKGAIKSGVKRMVGIGTCFEYDLSSGVLSTNSPIAPSTLYGSAKTSLYFNLKHWLLQENTSFAWCRLFYLFGEGERDNRLVPYIRKQLENGEEVLLTNGTQIRDYLDVADAAEQIVETALSDKEGPVNICSGIPTTIRQLVEKIADEYGRRDLLKFGTRKENLLDPPCVIGIKG